VDRAWVAVCLLCLLVLIPFGLLCACAFPNYDDFRIAASADSVGVIETVRSTYHSWSGRYFAYGSAAFLVRAGGLDGIYPLVPGLAFLLMVLGTWRLIKASWGPALTGRHALVAAGVVNVLYLATMHEVAEGYYWLASSTTYLAGQALAMLLFALLVGERDEPGARRALRAGGCVLLTVCIIGSNEILMVLVDMLLFLLLILRRRRGDRVALVTACVVAAAACSLIVLCAPGNASRYDANPGSRDSLYALGRALSMPVGLFLRWSAHPALWGLTILTLPLLRRLAERMPRARPLPLVALWFILMVPLFFLSYWSLGHKPSGRVLNTMYAAHLVWWIPFAATWLGRKTWGGPRLRIVAVIAVAVGLFAFGNAARAVGDVAGEAWPYRARMLERDVLARRQLESGQRNLVLPSVAPIPLTVYFQQTDLESIEGNRRAYAAWLGAGSVTIVPRR
jgi:hypothetical protein